MIYKEVTKKGWLYAEAFKGKDVDLTLKSYYVDTKTFSDSEGNPIDKICVAFHETDKKLALGDVHMSVMSELSGSLDTDDWVDKTFTFYPLKGKWFGKKATAIRVRSNMPTQKINPATDKETAA